MPTSLQTAICLLLAASALAPAVLAGGYDEYLGAIEKRNQQLHSDYLSGLGEGQRSFLDNLDSHVSDLQAKHYVRDSESYPSGFDADSYWTELLERTAASNPEARSTRGGPTDLDELGLDDADFSTDDGRDRMAFKVLGPAKPSRREEEPFLNRIWGTQKVSGGAGEPGQVTGPENKPQKAKIMTDRLPSYCDPPNPCPLNADPSKLTAPCDSGVQDTAEYNRNDVLRKMAADQCPCDNEHMECPAGTVSVTSKKASHMAGQINPYMLGNKRDKLDAKKSPRFSVKKRGVHAKFSSQVMKKKNPWLDGVNALDTVEKKAGHRMYQEEPLTE